MAGVKSTLDLLNDVARKVFRTFYPENFIVVSELLRHTEFVQADEIAKRLNLSEATVTKCLNDMRHKRFVHQVKYAELPLFWGFDYHGFVNIVRYKIAMLKRNEAEKAGSITSSSTKGGYVCLSCNRTITWEAFVKLAAASNNGVEPKCQARGCGGRLQKEAKRAAEGLKPLEVFSKALQRLEGKEIPTLGTRKMHAKIEEAARLEDEQRPEGAPKYEMPVLGPSKTVYVLQFNDVDMDARLQLAPPELHSLIKKRQEQEQRVFVVPPWLRSSPEEDQNEHALASGGSQDDRFLESDEADLAAVAEPGSHQRQKIDVKPRDCDVVELPHRVVTFEEAVETYPLKLAEQLSLCEEEHVISATEDGKRREEEVAKILSQESLANVIVVVAGNKIPLSQVTNDHILKMSTDEYQLYYSLYQQELHRRVEQLFHSTAT